MAAKKQPAKPEKAIPPCAECGSTAWTASGATQFRGRPKAQGGRGRRLWAHLRDPMGHEVWDSSKEARTLARAADKAAEQAAAPPPAEPAPAPDALEAFDRRFRETTG